MKKAPSSDRQSDEMASLRRKAEEKLRTQLERLKKLSARDIQELVHDLGTHQIELEMQNEELRTARDGLERSIIRWANNVTYTEGTAGVTWNTGISLYNKLSPKSAISYDTSMWGVNHPDWVIQGYRVGSLYRRQFYRTWLFYELAPEVTWPKDITGQRKPVYAFMFTLEVQFGK